MLKGYRTYIANILLVLAALQAAWPELTFLRPEVNVIVIAVLGFLVAFFRYLATK